MVKPIKDSERIIVGWGNDKNGRRCFFISHKEMPETYGNPITSDPKDLERKMTEVADRVDSIRKSRRNIKTTKINEYEEGQKIKCWACSDTYDKEETMEYDAKDKVFRCSRCGSELRA
ncbi:hypothetical protein M1439_02145 [Candidatus Marsarchaeota archaeon]|nr:hypothetical protein [Candidatus Marsarchaeota archaeon]MCL5122859.1 hypothetical protein [Candidatus Marsarchaeota archaeon]